MSYSATDLRSNKCEEYPNLFSSALLGEFDEEDFLERRETVFLLASLVEEKSLANAKEGKNDVVSDEEKEKLSLELIDEAREDHQEAAVETIAAAKNICAQCPVLKECTEMSLKSSPSDYYGVLAGMTLREREAQQNRLRRQKHQDRKITKTIAPSTPLSANRVDIQRLSEALAG